MYMSTSKEGWWEWVLRRTSILLHDNCLRESHYSFFSQCRVNSLSGESFHCFPWEVERPLTLAKMTHQNWGAECSQFRQGHSMHPHFNLQDPILFPTECPHINSRYPARLGVRFVLHFSQPQDEILHLSFSNLSLQKIRVFFRTHKGHLCGIWAWNSNPALTPFLFPTLSSDIRSSQPTSLYLLVFKSVWKHSVHSHPDPCFL